MPTLVYSGNYGTVSGTGTSGVSTTLTSANALPSNAVITNIAYSLNMSASSYSSSLNWRLYFINVYNGPSVSGNPYDYATMYSTTHTFSGNFGSINYNSAFTTTSISVTTRANCEGAPSSFLKEITITITYELPASPSTGSLSASSVLANNSLTLTLTNGSLSLLTHNILWKINDTYQSQQNLAQGVGTTNFTIPLSWINAITTATEGSASVTITTYQDGVSRGTNTYNFIILVPESVAPTISSFIANRVDNLVPSDWGIYVQTKSKVNLVGNATGAYGSTIVGYNIQGDGYTGTLANYTTGIINGSGTITYTLIVTDSRGRTATATVSISVYAYEAVKLTSTTLLRCLSNGTIDDNGTYGKVSGSVSFSSCNNKNAITSYKIYYKNSIDPDTSYVAITESATSGTSYIFGGGALIDVNSYAVKLVINDAFTEITQIIILPSALFTIFFRAGGKGIAFGKASTRENAVELNSDWGLWIGDSRIMAPVISATQPANGVAGMMWLKPIS